MQFGNGPCCLEADIGDFCGHDMYETELFYGNLRKENLFLDTIVIARNVLIFVSFLMPNIGGSENLPSGFRECRQTSRTDF